MTEFVIQIDFADRRGLGYEIFQIFEDHGCDKVFMEVSPGHGMMIKFRTSDWDAVEVLMTDIRKLNGVNSVQTKSQMAYEDRENELRTILNSVDEGIVAVDSQGIVTHINDDAARILDVNQSNSIGRPASDILGDESPIYTVLKSTSSITFEEGNPRNSHTIRFLASYVPILSHAQTIIGAVMTLKGENQIREIISSFRDAHHVTSFSDISYRSDKMGHLLATAKVVARGTSTVLIRGESGTGKELFARSIHTESPRKNHPFVAINCSALPPSLLESELFGYEPGTFTGALKTGKTGVFEQAHQGTLFLDEIGELSTSMQAQLLRVLQEGSIRRVGGTREISVDVRVIAATHRDLEAMIDSGQFRSDLYYRLNVIPLTIPPLRSRPEDIAVIAETLLTKISAKMNRKRCRLSAESINVLEQQPWPGNVRQLENFLERILNIVPVDEEISPQDLYQWTDVITVTHSLPKPHDELQINIPLGTQLPNLADIVAVVERQVIEHVLRQYPSSRKAGNVLGVSNTTILNKVKALDIPYPPQIPDTLQPISKRNSEKKI